MMKIVCLSDTHNRHELIAVPEGDILIHAGDATGRGTIDEIIAFNDWFANLPHQYKIFVAGNHDRLFETSNRFARTLLDSSIHYLQDSSIEIENLKIYGSPWQPRFFDWAFNLTRGAELAEKWRLIPNEVDILITHGPPFGILDEVPRRFFIENAGCEELRKRVEEIQPKLHIFGHIHCGYGTAEEFGVRFINASNCDENYEPTNPPLVFEI